MKASNPRRYEIEGKGQWGISEGLIYENVSFEDFDPQKLRAREGMRAFFGLDFGFTDPNALICLMFDENKQIIYVFDEWYEKGATNKRIANIIKGKGIASQKIICDSAEPKSIAELRDEGIRAEASRKGRDSVNHGIQLIQNYKIIVHQKNCPNFKTEILNYCWQKDKNGKMLDKPDHEFSHGPDAMRYAISYELRGDIFSFE